LARKHDCHSRNALSEAPAHGLPIIFFEKFKGAVAYLNLAAEMVKSKAQKE
jgi:cellulose biosynthesis protein BcsQ